MKTIDSRTVEFTDAGEMRCKEAFEDLLDEGRSISVAAATALERGIGYGYTFTAAFVDYLSEGTVWVGNAGTGKVMPTLKGADVEGLTAAGRAGMIRLIREGRTYSEALAHVKGAPRIVR